MGGRGGGGSWGGRGRSGQLEILNEDGTVVKKDLAAPPPLFPELSAVGTLPRRREPDAELEELKSIYREVRGSWRRSAFGLQLPAPSTSGMKRSLEEFCHSSPGKNTINTKMLYSIVPLSHGALPEDLITSHDRKISERAAPDAILAASKKAKESHLPDDFLKNFDVSKEGAEEADKKKEEEEEDRLEDDNDDMDDLNDSEIEDDDYMQGNEYDDDEGYYDDNDAGDKGDDEEAFF